MKALVNKELCELLPPAVMVLAIATVFGALDLLYNWRVDHCLGISLSLCIALAFGVAFLRGADAFARESRDHLSFLATWPLDRGTIWVVKFALGLSLAALTSLLSFAICLVLVRMAGYRDDDLARLLHDPGTSVFVALWFGCYALSFFWSTLLRIPLAAAGLGLATAALFGYGLTYLVGYLAGRWGPWLGFCPSEFSEAKADALTAAIATAVALVAFASSAMAFIRTPVLEAKRRAFRGLAWLLGSTLALLVLSVMTYYIATPLSLTDIESIQMDRDGRYLLLAASQPRAAVWVADLAVAGKPRLVARGASEASTNWAGGSRLLILWGTRTSESWSLDARTGRLRREPDDIAEVSPSGRLECRMTPTGLRVEDDTGRTIATYEGSLSFPGPVFSPDERYLYLVVPDAAKRPTMLPGPGMRGYRSQPPPEPSILLRLDLSTAARTAVAHLTFSPQLFWLSPDGRHAATYRQHALTLVDLTTGGQRTFPSYHPNGMEWVGDARYLWARESSSARKAPRPFHILDARSMTLARTIGPSELRAAAPSLTASKLAQQSVLVAQPRRDNGPIYFSTRDDARDLGHERLLWSANPDGTGLRFVMPYWVRQWVGVAASGELVFWEPTTAGPKITLVDPSTHRERLLF